MAIARETKLTTATHCALHNFNLYNCNECSDNPNYRYQQELMDIFARGTGYK